MAIQITQMMKAQPEKKSSVNQSISAATLRRNVGNAKAARVANAGRARSNVWSEDRVNMAVPTVNPVNHIGRTK